MRRPSNLMRSDLHRNGASSIKNLHISRPNGYNTTPAGASHAENKAHHLVSSLSSLGMGHKRNSSFAPNIHLQAAWAATRPKTTQSSSELPPRRLLPCTPPATSPAA